MERNKTSVSAYSAMHMPSDPLRVAKLKEQAVTRRRRKAARRLRDWTGSKMTEADRGHVVPCL